MKYINTFKTHASYEEKLNGVGVDISLPNVSYCKDVKDVHYNPYNTVKFYVGEVTEPKTVKIYTDRNTSVDVQVSEGNKWYSYVLPKDKVLCMIEGYSVKKVVVKADIKGGITKIIPSSTIEASFKGSNISNVTSTSGMFSYCTSLTSLDLSSWDTSKVVYMSSMFQSCSNLTSLDLSNFNTSKVTDMSYMFSSDSSLTSLNLSNFDTSNVTNMSNMFSYCDGLTSLDLSGWDTSKVTNMSDIFRNCTSLTSIRMVGCSLNTVKTIQDNLKEDNITGVTIVTE